MKSIRSFSSLAAILAYTGGAHASPPIVLDTFDVASSVDCLTSPLIHDDPSLAGGRRYSDVNAGTCNTGQEAVITMGNGSAEVWGNDVVEARWLYGTTGAGTPLGLELTSDSVIEVDFGNVPSGTAFYAFAYSVSGFYDISGLLPTTGTTLQVPISSLRNGGGVPIDDTAASLIDSFIFHVSGFSGGLQGSGLVVEEFRVIRSSGPYNSLLTQTVFVGNNGGLSACTNGGVTIASGLDDGADANDAAAGLADDGELDPGEVEDSTDLCNGTDGTDGIDGTDGTDGTDGIDGVDGAPGPEGPTGPQGPAGDAGAPGPQGPQGATGPMGEAGAAGPAGPAGPQGPAGDAGAMGAMGEPGAAGPAGPQGPAGDAGAMGAMGAPGAAGPAGPQGPAGDAGAMGAMGEPGATGPAGPQGPAGDAGAMGAMGAIGEPGPAGSQGATGSRGAMGLPGEPGADGGVGPAGAAGADASCAFAGVSPATRSHSALGYALGVVALLTARRRRHMVKAG
jgi:Collagen triple helix repeat (20 copies)